MDVKEFLNDKNHKLIKSEKFIDFLEELKKDALNAYGFDSNEQDCYKLPIKDSFLKKYPGFKAVKSFQEHGDALKVLIYSELEKLNISESQLAKRSNLNRQTLNKVINRQCFPNKKTMLALAVGLHYSPEEAKKLLSMVGYTFDYSSIPDLIVYTALEKKEYDIDDINIYIHEAGYNDFIGAKVREKKMDDSDISDFADSTFDLISEMIENGNTYESIVKKTGLTEMQINNAILEIQKRNKIRNEGYSSAIIMVALNLTLHNVDVGIITNACGITIENYNEIIDIYLKNK